MPLNMATFNLMRWTSASRGSVSGSGIFNCST